MLTVITDISPEALCAYLDRRIATAVTAGKQAVLLVPHIAWARQRKEMLAATVPFGVSVLTPFQFVQERWEVEGDGRRLVNQTARLLLVRELIAKSNQANADHPGRVLRASSRFVADLAAFLRAVAGFTVDAGRFACTRCSNLGSAFAASSHEQAVLQLAATYQEELAVRKLVEQNEALCLLTLENAGIALFVEGFNSLTPQQLGFFKQTSKHCDICIALEYDGGDYRYRGASQSFEALISLAGQHGLAVPDFLAGNLKHAMAETSQQGLGKAAREMSPASRPDSGLAGVGRVGAASNTEVIPLLTQGPHARNANVAKLLKAMVDGRGYRPEDCLVICKRLDGSKRSLLQACVLEDIPVQASLTLGVGEGSFGRAFLALRDLVTGGGRTAARRFIAEPFCGLASNWAFKLDAQWCGAVEAEPSRYIEDLAAENPDTANIIALAQGLFCAGDGMEAQAVHGLCDALLGFAVKRNRELETLDLADAYAAAAVITRAADQAGAEGLRYTIEDFEALQYSKSYMNEKGVTFAASSALPPRTYRLVLVLGLEATDYPMDVDARSFDRLLEALGAHEARQQEEDMRLLFARMMARAEETLVLERNLYDSEGRELRASALWDDVMDAYRSSDARDKGDVPAVLVPNMVKMNEGQLELMLPARSLQTQARRARLRGMPVSDDTPVCLADNVNNISGGEALSSEKTFVGSGANTAAEEGSRIPAYVSSKLRGEAADLARILEHMSVLSPTQIETYLCCPYKWFFEKKLRPEAFQEEFGPLQQGSFVHAVLEQFYRCFTGREETGFEEVTTAAMLGQRLTPDNLELAYPVLEACLTRCEEQAEGFNPADAAQKLDVERLYRNIRRFIALDSIFLPGYMPQYFELCFGDDAGAPVEYAGERIRGSIDRVDVHEAAGYAAIVDYKTGGLDKYMLPSCKEGLPAPGPYVQAHVYASVAARLLGLKPVASLYRSVGTTRIAGAWDKDCLEGRDASLPKGGGLPYDKTPAGEPGSYQDYLDLTEEYVADRMRSLRAGDIRPNPANAKVCEYCLARHICEKGGA